jgi:hypothetical protein
LAVSSSKYPIANTSSTMADILTDPTKIAKELPNMIFCFSSSLSVEDRIVPKEFLASLDILFASVMSGNRPVKKASRKQTAHK